MGAFEECLNGLEAGDASRVVEAVREDTILRVAVHAEPFVGRDAIALVFGHLLSGIMSDLHRGEVIADGARRVATFGVTIAGYSGTAEGLNVISLDEQGGLEEITVFLRPLAALQALSDEVGRRLGVPRPE